MLKSFKTLSHLFNKVTLTTFIGSYSLLSYNTVLANDEMKFSWIRECETCTPKILAQGTIKEHTPKLFQEFIDQNNPNKDVVLNSIGGSMVGGFALGKLFKEYGFNTVVKPTVNIYTVVGEQPINEMICYSACAYAFLGGHKRTVEDGGLYGVHAYTSISGQNHFLSKHIANNYIKDYLKDINITQEYFDIATATDNEDMNVLSRDELIRLNIINN